jgi:hypothetical protein
MIHMANISFHFPFLKDDGKKEGEQCLQIFSVRRSPHKEITTAVGKFKHEF